MDTCRLCDERKDLLRSHIVPEFFYKPVYDRKHRLHTTRLDTQLSRTPPLQKGLRERLLCRECEQKFGRLESYGRGILYGSRTSAALEPYLATPNRQVGGLSIPYRTNPIGFWTTGGIVLNDVDYQTVRLFGLSLLWRMAIASHMMWQNIQLGPYESIIRTMLTTDDAEQPDQLPFVCMVPLFDGLFFHGVILQPDCVETSGGFTVRALLGGYLFVFMFGGAYTNDSLAPFFVRPNGQWTLPIVNAMDLDFLRHNTKKMKAAIQTEARTSAQGEA